MVRRLAIAVVLVASGVGQFPVAVDATVPVAADCVSSAGPGIPPPASIPSGIPGFHAAWYGQSGYPTLCPGDRSTAVVAFYNTGGSTTGFSGTRDPRIVPLALTASEQADLVAFLHTLTGDPVPEPLLTDTSR